MPDDDHPCEPRTKLVHAAAASADRPPLPAVPVEVVEREAAAAAAFARAEKAEATRRAYRHDFARFAAWCAARGAAHLPTAP